MSEPLPTCYLNGSLMPLREARVSALDRSFLFGDGVYEVIPVRAGNARRLAANLARLAHSLHELRIRNPFSDQQWSEVVQQLVSANGGGDLYVYVQVSRGAEFSRNHAPLPDIEPTVFGFCAPLPLPTTQLLERGVAKEALEAFEATKAKEPNRFNGYVGAAQAAQALGDTATAKANYEKLLSLASSSNSERPTLAAARAFVASN